MSTAAAGQKIPGFAPMAWLWLFFLYAPIMVVALFSFNSSRLVTVWEDFSVEWYQVMWANDELRRACVNSLIVGLGATFFSTMIAIPTALAMHSRRSDFRGKHLAYMLITLPILMPEIVVAIAILAFFSMIGLNLGIINVLIAHTIFCIPFAYSPIWVCLEAIPHRLWEASSDLYADPRKTFYHVTLPLLKPGIISGMMLAFISSIDDFIITQMVAPPGAMTLPVYIYSMVRKGITPEINAVSTILLAVSIVFVLVSYLINRQRKGDMS